jgi:hypothetical protein
VNLTAGVNAAIGSNMVSVKSSVVPANETLILTSDDSAIAQGSITFAALSAATATPAAPFIGQLVTLSAPTSGTGVNTVWDFGDGTTGTGTSTTHLYLTAGSFTAKATLAETTTVSVLVTVLPAVVGVGPDADGDGFSDSFETLAGTDPALPGSTPTGSPITATTTQPLTVSKASIKLSFASGGKDAISFSGTANLAGFNPAGKKVLLDAGGVARVFTLDSKASGKSGSDLIKFKANASALNYSVKLSKGTFATPLAAHGLTNAPATGAAVQVPFTLVLNNSVFQSVKVMSYTSKLGKGAAK